MKNENKTAGQKAVIYFIALAIGFAVTFLTMLIFATVSVTADLNEMFATPFAALSLSAGGITSGFIASRRLKKGGLINGAVCGGVIFFVVLIISLIADDGGLTINTLFNFIISLLSSVIGGVWGVSRKPRKII